MKQISVEKPAAIVRDYITGFEKASKLVPSPAGQMVIGEIISALRGVETDLNSPAYKDPYRATIFTIQARIRDFSTPSHVSAIYVELLELMGGRQ